MFEYATLVSFLCDRYFLQGYMDVGSYVARKGGRLCMDGIASLPV